MVEKVFDLVPADDGAKNYAKLYKGIFLPRLQCAYSMARALREWDICFAPGPTETSPQTLAHECDDGARGVQKRNPGAASAELQNARGKRATAMQRTRAELSKLAPSYMSMYKAWSTTWPLLLLT